MPVTDSPTREAVADTLDKAADHIHANGFCRKYLYDTRQADGGTLLEACRVDIIGAINLAVHGTPRHVGGNPLTAAAEQAVNDRIDAPSIVAWCDLPGNGGQQAIALLRETANELRAEVAA